MERFANTDEASQQQLFPHKIHFSPSDIEVVKSLKNELKTLGFVIEEQKNDIIVKGVPAGMSSDNVQGTLETIVEDAKNYLDKPGIDKKIKLSQTMAAQLSVKRGKILTEAEMSDIFDKLFACSLPNIAPKGEKIVAIIPVSHLESFLK